MTSSPTAEPSDKTPAFAKWSYHAIRCLLGVWLLFAGIAKLFDLPALAQTIADFGIVYDGFQLPVATTVSTAEVLVGALLVADRRGILAVVVAMLAGFAVLVFYGLIIELDIECGCLGNAVRHDLATTLRIDLVLLILCAYLYVARSRWSLGPVPRKRPRNTCSSGR